MNVPVRMVCGDCLRSVEIRLDGAETSPTFSTCPYCGGTIECRLIERETETSDQHGPIGIESIPGMSKLWTETWIKGTLGTLGRFQLRELLGDGGFGQVFQAYDPRLDRDFALKVLRQTNPGERVMQRFFREARAVARLAHPNIVAVYDAGSDDGRCWIAYQYVSGRTLLREHEQRRLERDAVVRIIRDLADALDYAHRQGIYHRDLKPSNIIVDVQGRPHLIDFGLARRADLDSDLTRDGAVLGTPVYMSPEQASGRSKLADGRSDVYSLGVIFFELLCGQRPNNLPSQAPVWTTNPVEPPPSLRSLDRTIPPAIDRICRKTLAIDPAQRHPDAGALRDELDLWLQRRNAPTRFSHPLAFALLGIAATLLVVVSLKAVLAPSVVEGPAVAVASRSTPVPPIIEVPAVPKAETRKVGSAGIEPAPGIITPPVETRATVSSPGKNEGTPRLLLVGNKSRKVYHIPTCNSLDSMKDANWFKFTSADQAFEAGFQPCKICRPPLSKLAHSSRSEVTPED